MTTTYKLNNTEVEFDTESRLSTFNNNTYARAEFYDLIKRNYGVKPSDKRALTTIYEVIFEGLKTDIVEIISK